MSNGYLGNPNLKPAGVKIDFTKEQIEDRQRFYKQCALLLNIHRLSPKFEEIVINRQGTKGKTDGPDKSKPFGGRFWRAKSDGKQIGLTCCSSSGLENHDPSLSSL